MPRDLITMYSPFPFVEYRDKNTSLQTLKEVSPCPSMGYRDKKTSLQMIKKVSPCPSVGYRDKKTHLLYVFTSPSPSVGHRMKEIQYLVRYFKAAFFRKGELGGVLARLS